METHRERRRPAVHAATLAAMLSFAPAVAAQQRAALLGTVRGADGAAVAGATVTVIEDDPDLAGIDPVDVLEASTDARGRFKVDALCGVRYAAVAVGPATDGRARVAQPAYGLACGRRAELRLAMAGAGRDAPAPGLATYGAPADLRVHCVLPHAGGHALPLALREGPAVAIPAIAAVATLELRDRAGACLTELFAPPHDGEVDVAPPRAIRVRVGDSDGEPVPGARVGVQTLRSVADGVWTPVRYVARDGPVAVTGADGTATVSCPTRDDPFADGPEALTIAAIGADGRSSVSGWTSKQPFTDWRIVALHDRDHVRVTLPSAAPAAGRAAGTGVVGGPARAFVAARARQDKDGVVFQYFVRRRHDVAIGADGTFVLPVAAEHTATVTIVTPPVGGRRVVWLPGRGGALPDLDLATCTPLSARIVDATGGPAAAAELLLVPHDCTGHDVEHAPALVPDPAGRVDVLLQRGRWTLLAADATHWSAVEIDGEPAPLTLTLAPKPSVRVRVVDAAGEPVAGARFEPEWFPSPPRFGPLVGVDAALAALDWNHFAAQVRAVTTDANGDAVLCWLPLPGMQPKVFAFLGDHRRRSDEAAVADGAERIVLKLRQ